MISNFKNNIKKLSQGISLGTNGIANERLSQNTLPEANGIADERCKTYEFSDLINLNYDENGLCNANLKNDDNSYAFMGCDKVYFKKIISKVTNNEVCYQKNFAKMA